MAHHIVFMHSVLGLIGTLAISWFCFAYFESRVRNLKERFTVQLQPEPVLELQS